MAIYEYRCDDCRTKFTVTESISEHGEKKRRHSACPKCGGRNTRQSFSTFFAKTSSKS
jgi:putative FmdB family regulatory protein